MEKAMKHKTLPATDSIEELAKFWETHDLADFEEHLEEADEPVFVRPTGTSLTIDLQPIEAQRLKRIARSRRVKESTVVRQWIIDQLQEYSSSPRQANKLSQPTPQKRRRS
jgi:hypothetical protein